MVKNLTFRFLNGAMSRGKLSQHWHDSITALFRLEELAFCSYIERQNRWITKYSYCVVLWNQSIDKVAI